MLRLRFAPGLILGLLFGLPAGIVIGLMLVPAARTVDPNSGMGQQVQELTRKLDAAREDKERTEKQFEQFQKLAEQMTASFGNLEQRFLLLEEEQRLRDARAPTPVPPASVRPVPTEIPAPPASPTSAVAAPPPAQ
jgi:hypothetical protein